MDGDVAGVGVEGVLEAEDDTDQKKAMWHLPIVEVTGEVKAFPGSISHCFVSVDPAG